MVQCYDLVMSATTGRCPTVSPDRRWSRSELIMMAARVNVDGRCGREDEF